ncbi:hypothetical protein Tco_0852027 [Tanacetum coccineum]
MSASAMLNAVVGFEISPDFALDVAGEMVFLRFPLMPKDQVWFTIRMCSKSIDVLLRESDIAKVGVENDKTRILEGKEICVVVGNYFHGILQILTKP